MWHVSAYAAQNSTGDQGNESTGTVDILGNRIEPVANRLFGALVDRLEGKVLSSNPQEHDAGQQGTQWADVDGDHVHPPGYNTLDADSHDVAQHMDDGGGGHPLHLELLLQKRYGRLIQVDDGADAGEEHADVEDNAHNPSAGHSVEHVDKIDKHQARAAGA